MRRPKHRKQRHLPIEADKAKQEVLEAGATAAAAKAKAKAAAATVAVKEKEKKAQEAQKAKAAGGSTRGITTIAQQAQNTELPKDLQYHLGFDIESITSLDDSTRSQDLLPFVAKKTAH
jgi:hypothetical protein